MYWKNQKAVGLSILFSVLFIFTGNDTNAQISYFRELKGGELNTISTAVPFISICPDSRAGALGDAGVATKPDLSSQHWNVAKYAFMEEDGGFNISYTPWLRNLNIPDINLAYLSTYYKPSRNQVVSGSLRYFSLGEIQFTDMDGRIQGQLTPFEMAIDVGYSRLFTDNFSGGVTFRYIHSNLTNGQYVGGEETNAGIAAAVDIGAYYQNDLYLSGTSGAYAIGMSLSNMGTPITYGDDGDPMPLPANLRIGGRFDYDLDDYNSLSFSLEFNKLMVPSPPIMNEDSLVRGYKTPESIVQGMLQSFYDAPGITFDDGSYSSVFREELAEVTTSVGVEYWYQNQFAIRGGYFHESSVKGNRKYMTLGVGLKLNVFSLDLAYLVPTTGIDSSPLANTVRFTLGFDFDSLKF